MRQKAARFGATLAVAGSLAAGLLTAAAPAGATTTGWIPYQGFRTFNACGQAGQAEVILHGYRAWDCRWDSPFYMLWLLE